MHFKKEDGTIEYDMEKGFNSYKIVFNCEKCKKEVSINYRSFKKRPIFLCRNCKRTNTDLKNHGVEFFSNREKFNQTNIERYGSHPMKTKEFKKKSKQTNLERYGVDNPFKSEKIKEKIKETNLERYGVENVSHLKETKEKRKQTCLERYGTEKFTNQKKREETNLEKYGTKTPLKLDRTNWNFPYYENQKEETFKKLKNIKGFELLSNKYFGQNYVYNFKCNICNEVFSRYIRGGDIKINCPKCTPYGESSYERELRSFLDDLGVEHLGNNREIIKPYEIDIYIPSIKLGIEINGLYWHSEKFKDKKYHYNKYKLAKESGIELWQFFEDEWLYKKDIILNKIRLKLGIYNKKIFARKCFIKNINQEQSSEILEHHLIGPDRSSIKLGLFYEDELVSAMTFIKKENGYILNRYITKSGYVVIGAFSKLLKHFTRNYFYEFIESFSENRYSYGDVYSKNGFKLDYEVSPDYWYVIGDKREHKFNYRKKQIKKKFNIEENENSFTEKDKMKELGVNRIYNAGLTKWVL